MATYWKQVARNDTRARLLADRHYSRQHPGISEFCPPGDNIVLLGIHNDALWVSHRPNPYADLDKPRQDGFDYWDNPYFRNESSQLASDLIREALAITVGIWWGTPYPEHGFHSFISTNHVKPTKRRGENIWGYVYRLAGFYEYHERTKSRGLLRMIYPLAALRAIQPISPYYEQTRLL